MVNLFFQSILLTCLAASEAFFLLHSSKPSLLRAILTESVDIGELVREMNKVGKNSSADAAQVDFGDKVGPALHDPSKPQRKIAADESGGRFIKHAHELISEVFKPQENLIKNPNDLDRFDRLMGGDLKSGFGSEVSAVFSVPIEPKTFTAQEMVKESKRNWNIFDGAFKMFKYVTYLVGLNTKELPAIDPLLTPSKDLTGVDEDITRICATLSRLAYEVNNQSSFAFSNKNLDVHATSDIHGILHTSTPTFVKAFVGDETMVVCWRGSFGLLDWINNFAVAPVSSPRWSGMAEALKAHCAYCSLVENDLALHQKEIVKDITDGKIKELILTGHSLAGGMAQVAHALILGAMSEDPDWQKVKDQVKVRTVAFSAPMTYVVLDESNDKVKNFLKTISEHSCNIVYSCDPVPHAPGDVKFLTDWFALAMEYQKKKLKWGEQALCNLASVQSRILSLVEDKNVREVDDMLKVCQKYRHIGKIIYYENHAATPVPLSNIAYKKLTFEGRTRSDLIETHSALTDKEYGLAYDVSI